MEEQNQEPVEEKKPKRDWHRNTVTLPQALDALIRSKGDREIRKWCSVVDALDHQAQRAHELKMLKTPRPQPVAPPVEFDPDRPLTERERQEIIDAQVAAREAAARSVLQQFEKK